MGSEMCIRDSYYYYYYYYYYYTSTPRMKLLRPLEDRVWRRLFRVYLDDAACTAAACPAESVRRKEEKKNTRGHSAERMSELNGLMS